MPFFQDPPRYNTFLVTLWEERNQDPTLPGVWRFRLEDPGTGQRQGFTDLKALVTALEQEMTISDESTLPDRDKG